MISVKTGKRLLLSAGLLFSASCILSGAGFPDELKTEKGGAFRLGGISFEMIHFKENWSSTTQRNQNVKLEPGFPVQKSGEFQVQGQFSSFKFDEKLSAADDGSIKCEYKLNALETLTTNEISLLMSLPSEKFGGASVKVDGKEIILPVEFTENKTGIFSSATASEIVIGTEKGKMLISGIKGLLIQDDRKWNSPAFSFRFYFNPSKGEIKETSLNFTVKLSGYDSKQTDLKSAVNMGFKDDFAGDGKGGWTDQGPDNDIRMIKPGTENFAGLKFDIIDPAKNNGKSCIVLGQADTYKFPLSASATAPAGSFKNLYLLHAEGWSGRGIYEAGKVKLSYKDGSETIIPVMSGKDLSNWWAPSSRENGTVVWTGENASAYVGLFLSKYPVDAKEIANITFESNAKSIWMIVGATFSNEDVPLPKSQPTYIIENSEWKPFKYEKDIVKGSVMDFSFLANDAPAGKYGPVIVKDGKLSFANAQDKRLRLYGANTCFTTNYMDKESCDRLAERFVAIGYNTLRIHHYDAALIKKDSPTGTDFDPEQLDKLDYLFYAFKKRGIYISIDLYTTRTIPGGVIPGFKDKIDQKQFKGLALINDDVMKNWEMFTKNLLTHVNPYTGLAWKDDPALINTSLINEDVIFAIFRRDGVTELYNAAFEEYLKENKITLEPNSPMRERYMKQFLISAYNKAYKRMYSFIHSLGTKMLITDQNMWSNASMAIMRDQYDIVDNHFYWDHPTFLINEWRLPSGVMNKSAISRGAPVPVDAGTSRIFGKPMFITEFDYVAPNEFRSEGGPLIGAYSALQDWDALYRFAYAHSSATALGDKATGFFDVASNPLSLASEKIGLLLYLRGDVKKSDVSFPLVMTDKYCLDPDAPDYLPSEIWKLGLIGKTGSVMVKEEGKMPVLPKDSTAVIATEKALTSYNSPVKFYPVSKTTKLIGEMQKDGVISAALADAEKGIFKSSTGEIELNQAALSFKAVTAKSEVIVSNEKSVLEGKLLKLENLKGFSTVSVSSVDGKAIADSSRLLIFHLTDVQNTKEKFGDSKKSILENWGVLPYLVKDGKAVISISGKFNGYKLYAVSLSGRRLFEVPYNGTDKGISFEASVLRKDKEPAIAYELVKE